MHNVKSVTSLWNDSSSVDNEVLGEHSGNRPVDIEDWVSSATELKTGKQQD